MTKTPSKPASPTPAPEPTPTEENPDVVATRKLVADIRAELVLADELKKGGN